MHTKVTEMDINFKPEKRSVIKDVRIEENVVINMKKRECCSAYKETRECYSALSGCGRVFLIAGCH